MATRDGIKFSVHLITNHFGNLVAKVCECLLRRGPLTFEQLGRFTEVTKEQVKNFLLVLVQNNCVQAFILEQEASSVTIVKMVGVKLEVDDSAIQNSMSGFGGVIKDDEEGRWICGFSCKLTSVLLQLLN
ncbi:hypothetical protein K1719_017478 [Acacia pycnantha]|nr:hypothetical protein K1719_017478 [Acacia pycnantha]